MAWGNLVGELNSMRDAKRSRSSYDVFGNLTNAQLREHAKDLLNLGDDTIRAAVERFGPGNATVLLLAHLRLPSHSSACHDTPWTGYSHA